MENQAITVTKILAIYASARHDHKMAGIVKNEMLKCDYESRWSAKWECLQIMLGFETMWETMNAVEKLAKRNKAAA